MEEGKLSIQGKYQNLNFEIPLSLYKSETPREEIMHYLTRYFNPYFKRDRKSE